ncbi:MAG: response regulator [Hydrococcus sp. C42_A2020_068]|uniref:response regulator n=1 Tax=Pleurocapsa sp. PCC 7327 TaxID=118163 RepID=UPI00029F8235|nr:response regulator [Pleurocapsa sp. PCC 7327]AFY75804.1 response regulator with CheY-like receiver, AAA-type ATPase, and DNA-binding domains [Pleurocapsa sp. PCC 7327]MBF2020418.1 response regulator [Hydrococcus sp. C42_A2020_068]
MTTKRILVIDNEQYIQEVTQICLETVAGWQVITASSGLEGLSKAESEQPDAILLDLIMPEMDGLTTFKKLQENPLTRQIPVIFLTAKVIAFGDSSVALNTLTAIPKPFNPLELANQISEILGWTD